jgi:hypothetical protein
MTQSFLLQYSREWELKLAKALILKRRNFSILLPGSYNAPYRFIGLCTDKGKLGVTIRQQATGILPLGLYSPKNSLFYRKSISSSSMASNSSSPTSSSFSSSSSFKMSRLSNSAAKASESSAGAAASCSVS